VICRHQDLRLPWQSAPSGPDLVLICSASQRPVAVRMPQNRVCGTWVHSFASAEVAMWPVCEQEPITAEWCPVCRPNVWVPSFSARTSTVSFRARYQSTWGGPFTEGQWEASEQSLSRHIRQPAPLAPLEQGMETRRALPQGSHSDQNSCRQSGHKT
jgi:hypothetical protein